MTKLKIVADDKIPFLRGVFEAVADVVYLPGAKTAAQDVADADALITRTRTRCSRELLQGSRVKFIASATIGFDHINRDDMASLGIHAGIPVPPQLEFTKPMGISRPVDCR